MKRCNYLFEQIWLLDNLQRAFRKAARGKRRQPAVQAFEERLTENLSSIRRDVLAKRFTFGRFNQFVIRDPKLRTIHACRFDERVLHHAIMNVCHPCFDRQLNVIKMNLYEGYWPESGPAWWQLLEPTAELPFRVPQQERPVEPERQHWLPPGRSSLGDGCRRMTQPSSGTRLLLCTGDQAPDVSRIVDASPKASGAYDLTIIS